MTTTSNAGKRKRTSPEVKESDPPPQGDFFDSIWGFFSSVKLAIMLIIIIAIASLIGALLVQAPGAVVSDPTEYNRWLTMIRGKYGSLTDIYNLLQFFNLYNAIWFKLLLATLSFNIIICTTNRLPGIWQAFRNPRIKMNDAFYNAVPIRASFRTKGNPVEAISSELASKRYQVFQEKGDNATYIYGDKNGWAKLGTIATHLSLILLLAGAIVGGLYGFSDDGVMIVEGETYDVGRDLGFALRADKFTMELYPDGRPKDYRTDLVVVENGKDVVRQTVRVNEPLEYKGVRFHQSFYGPAPFLEVKDTKTGSVLFSEPIALSSQNQGYNTGYAAIPGTGITAYLGAVPSGTSYSNNIVLQVYTGSTSAGNSTLTLDQPKVVGDLEYTFKAASEFTGLRMVSDPGVPIVWIASALMILGLCVTFYLPRRRVWIKVAANTVTMAGVADKIVRFEPEFEKLVGALDKN